MDAVRASPRYCAVEQRRCVRWAEEYFKDCLCNLGDAVSFGFGILSLVCWGIAEVPQIITNFRNKSAHGVSLAFLSTWIVGDVFNLVGCILEPATLPTQFFTALLYTTSTVVLALQCIYYVHFLRWWNRRNLKSTSQDEAEETKPLKPEPTTKAHVEVPRRKEVYFMSARSLASSDTPPLRGSYIKARSGPPAFEGDTESSNSDGEETANFEGYTYSQKPVAQPRPIPPPGKYGTFVAVSSALPLRSNGFMNAYTKFSGGRKLLQEHEFHGNTSGQWLGWLMAAIYMGGRVPQIWLNIKRGSVEGLNPLMFVFALVANATYVASILVRTTDWEKIKPNMPWLLDAVVCVALDLFIILQYVYYKRIRRKRDPKGFFEDYIEANKINY